MTFLEKNLEDILFDEYDACYERGFMALKAKQKSDINIWMRQPVFPDFGRADLIAVEQQAYAIAPLFTVIECKKDAIDIHAYIQAKRYVTALKSYQYCSAGLRNSISSQYKTVLVGSHVNFMSGFFDLFANDADCEIYTYNYKATGIHFTKQIKSYYNPNVSHSVRDNLVSSINGFINPLLAKREEDRLAGLLDDDNDLPF